MKHSRKLRQTLVYLLVFLLCAGISGPAFAAGQVFTDVPQDYWASPYIYDMEARGVVSGYGDGTFGPENLVLRCEYAKMLAEVTGLPVEDGLGTPYIDVNTEEWYYPYIRATQEYINGYTYGENLYFFPEATASREDVTVALMKALGDDLSAYYYMDNLLADTFWDYQDIAEHNRPYIAAAVDRGFITGHQDGSFRGQDPIIRAEICAVLYRAFPPEETTAEPTAAPAETAAPTASPAPVLFDESLNVSFLDVGQGDAAFIELPNEQTLLIDAGTAESADDIISYIEGRGYESLDYVVATHPHADHIGGMAEILQHFPVGSLFMPDAMATTETYQEMLEVIREKNIPVTAASTSVLLLEDNSLLAYFVAPNSSGYSDLNDYSAAVKLIYGQTSFLFMGDAETVSEQEILDANIDVSADVLKVGHHGSSSSTGEEFLAAVHPAYAVISCGADNSYGHPDQALLNRLAMAGVNILRTDELGTIYMESDGNAISMP